jgi:hypothetical protein
MVKQIRYLDPVPEYYARRTAKRLGWDMHGELSGGYSDPFKPLNRFKGVILHAGRLTPGDSPSSQQTRGHQPFRFLGLPLEVRHRIYDYACESPYKPFWPECPARWNSGFGLLLVSRQISTEALPSIYRTFRIHGGRPLDAVGKLGPKLAYIRRLELHLSCFCPSGGRNLWHNNGTLFAARAADAQTTPWRPLGNVPPNLAVRLAQPYPGCGKSVKAVSQPMAKYIKATEEAWAEWNLRRKTWLRPRGSRRSRSRATWSIRRCVPCRTLCWSETALCWESGRSMLLKGRAN